MSLNKLVMAFVKIIQVPGLGLTEFPLYIKGVLAYVDTGLKIPLVHKIKDEAIRERFNNSLKRFKIDKDLFGKLDVKSFWLFIKIVVIFGGRRNFEMYG